MKTFDITVNGNSETIKAKHLGGGKFIVCKRKTCNFAQVNHIETLFGNSGNNTYRIKDFYPTSPYFNQNVEQSVTMEETDGEE